MTRVWKEIERLLDGITLDIYHRCYDEQDPAGVRYIVGMVRNDLSKIEALLLKMDMDGVDGHSYCPPWRLEETMGGQIQ